MIITENGSTLSSTDCPGLKALDFSFELGCIQIMSKPTHRFGNFLGFIVTDTHGVANNVSQLEPLTIVMYQQ